MATSDKQQRPDPYERDVIIAVFDGGSAEVLHLDFSFLNLKFYSIESPEFKDLVDGFNYFFPQASEGVPERDFKSTIYYDMQYNGPGGYHPNLYALVPIDFKKAIKRDTFFAIESVLLIIFPCDFQLRALVHYNKEDNDKFAESFTVSYDPISFAYIKNGYELLIKIETSKIPEINKTIPLVYNFVTENKSFEIAINSYVEGFKQRYAKMAYVCYCIALEAMVDSSEGEITYKIARTTAVINADKKDDGEILFFNTKQFYKLRSKIVHGGRVNFLNEYFFPLQALLSRTLIEIITLGIEDAKALSIYVHQSGFGDKGNKEGYVKKILNTSIEQLVLKKVNN